MHYKYKFEDELVLFDLRAWRNSNYIKQDMETLEYGISDITDVDTPSI